MKVFKVWSLSLMVSSGLGLFLDSPRGFLNKFSQRFKIDTLRKIVDKTPVARFDELESAGEFTQALRELEKESFYKRKSRGLLTKRRIKRELCTLSLPIMKSEHFSDAVTYGRIMYFATNSFPYTTSGYSIRTHEIVKNLQTHDLNVKVCTRYNYPFVVGKIARESCETVDGVEYLRILDGWYRHNAAEQVERAVRLLVDLCRDHGTEALQTTSGFLNAVVVSQAAKTLGVPWVYEVRGDPHNTWLSKLTLEGRERRRDSEFYSLLSEKEIEAARAAGHVVTLSEISRKKLVQKGVESRKILVVPNGVDRGVLDVVADKQSARTKLGLENCYWLGTVSSIVSYEGLENLILALEKLPSGVKTLIVGDGECLPALRELAIEKGLEARVRFIGRVSREESILWTSALDVFVIPRVDTPVTRNVTPLKQFVPMALGIPVVASDLAALKEATGNLANYFEPENVDSLVASVSEVLRGEHKAKEARTWLMDHTWQHSGQLLRNFYIPNRGGLDLNVDHVEEESNE